MTTLALLLAAALASEPTTGSAPTAAPDAPAPAAPAPARTAAAVAKQLAGSVTFQPKLTLQARLDAGDLVKTRDGRAWSRTQDLSLRRVRFGARGTALGGLRWYVTFDADRAGEIGRPTTAKLKDAAIEWRAAGEVLALRVGKAKLPYTRIGLTSSAEQLLLERPAWIESARDLYDSSTPLNVLARSKLAGGLVTLHAAAADGWQPGATLRSAGPGQKVYTARPLLVGRVELAPPGWVEASRSDAHAGEGRHVALGGTYAWQDRIAYADGGGEERVYFGVDLSFHLGPVTAQAEWGESRITSTVPAIGERREHGWYAQAGYLLPWVPVELAARYEDWDEVLGRPGARQRAALAGVNVYLSGSRLKLQVNAVHRWFGETSSGRLPGADARDLLQAQLQLQL